MCLHKLAIIVARNDEKEFDELVASLQQLDIPDDMNVELIPVVEYRTRASACAYAMKNSDAKYKIYMREDCRIADKTLLTRIVDTFKSHADIGMIGLSGTRVIPTHLDCLSAKKRAGIVNIKGDGICRWQNNGDLTEVMAVDEYFLATQYDFPWDEDLLSSDFLSFLAQGISLCQHGYKIAVLPQIKPSATVSYMLNETISVTDRDLFLDKYSMAIFPLVTVLLQTHNRPKMFEEALNSVLRQTYRNLEVVISDNSDYDDTQKLIQRYIAADKRIKYFRNKGFTVYENTFFLCEYDNPEAEFINWLADDDGFYPGKLEQEINYYLEDDNLSLVTSCRRFVDEAGNILKDEDTSAICQKTSIIDAKSAARYMILNKRNFIGEQSTVLLKKSFLRLPRPIYEKKYNLHSKYLMLCWKCDDEVPLLRGDMPMWLYLLEKGNMVYITEPLAWFRNHKGQLQRSDEVACRQEVLNWGWCIVQGFKRKVIEPTEVSELITFWLTFFSYTVNNMHGFKLREEMWSSELYQMAQEMIDWLYKGAVPQMKYLLSEYVYEDELVLKN